MSKSRVEVEEWMIGLFRVATGFKAGQSPKGNLGLEREVAQTLNAKMSALEPTMYAVSYSQKFGEMMRLSNHEQMNREVAVTLSKSDGKLGDNSPTVVCFQQNTRDEVRKINGDGAIAGAIAASPGMKQQNYIACLTPEAPQTHRVYGEDAAWPSMKAEVRRLTEVECCRLQGIPDDHAFIHGKDTSSSSVYGIMGNGWARNCSRMVFKNIHLVDGKINGGVRPFKIGTVSSGQGTHELSVQDFGDKSVFCADIAPFPCELLATRFPEMPNFGDVTRISYDADKGVIHNRKKDGYQLMSEQQLGFKPVDAETKEVPLKYGEMDCISGGLPCTSVSVAGKRAGAAEGSGTRSALAYELPRIGNECGARWLVYENVPGLASSNGGTDLAWFLYRLQEAGYCVAWRTLDARFVRSDLFPRAVPQRRRRIWLVAYRGSDWRVPCETLFEPMKVLGSEPPVLTVGVGFDGRVGCASEDDARQGVDVANGEPNSELEEFKEFVKTADGKILCVLVDRGVCISASERMRELEEEDRLAKAKLGGGDDLFGGDLFGEPEEKHQGRGLKAADLELVMPKDGSIRKVGDVGIYQWAQTVCQEVLFCGELFAGEKKIGGESRSTADEESQIPLSTSTSSLLSSPTVDDLNPNLLANIGNAGFLSDGYCVTMKMPEWNAGVTEENLATMPKELAALYDGDVCGLSDILEDDVDPKYRLSWRACYGILNRAVKRGKKLPIELGYALVERIIEQASFVKWKMLNGKDNVSPSHVSTSEPTSDVSRPTSSQPTEKPDKLSERDVARNCYEAFVAFMKPIESVEAVDPKSVGVDDFTDANESAAEVDALEENNIDIDSERGEMEAEYSVKFAKDIERHKQEHMEDHSEKKEKGE